MRHGSDLLPWYSRFAQIRVNKGQIEIRLFPGFSKRVIPQGTSLDSIISKLKEGRWYRPWTMEIDE